jgi:hypothetical protein
VQWTRGLPPFRRCRSSRFAVPPSPGHPRIPLACWTRVRSRSASGFRWCIRRGLWGLLFTRRNDAFYLCTDPRRLGQVFPTEQSAASGCDHCAQPKLKLPCLNSTQPTPKKSEPDKLECRLTSAQYSRRLNERISWCRSPCERARQPARSTRRSSTRPIKGKSMQIQSSNRKWPSYKLNSSS